MEEYAELLVPVTDPRHQVVKWVVQHLAQRNKDIPEVNDISWTVHVVQSPSVNAFVLPVSKDKLNTKNFTIIRCNLVFTHLQILKSYFPFFE